MRLSFTLILITLIILDFSSCNRTCEDVQVGETELSAQAENFLVYEADQLITFKNTKDELITFKASITESEFQICQKVTCRPVDPYKSNYCEYLSSPIVELFLQSDSTLLGITASVNQYETESDLLYDAIKFNLSHVNDGIQASHITAARFTDPPFQKSDLVDIDHFVQFHGVIDLEGQDFYDIMAFEHGGMAFYFKEYVGFVAFRTKTDIWFKI